MPTQQTQQTETKALATSTQNSTDSLDAAPAPAPVPIPIRSPSKMLGSNIPRHWNADDPFATHFLNALSSTFPFGEAFFVRSVLRYRDRVEDPALRERIRGFAGQEGQHSRVHDDHVEMLLDQGYSALATRNALVDRIARWQNRRFPKYSLAMTAALEHLTALLARQVLSDVELRTGAMHPDMAKLWRWHALEEAEHKAVAYDVLMRVDPSHGLRVVVMIFNTIGLTIEVMDRLVYMLWKDGVLFRRKTWSNGWRHLFGEGGILRGTGADYRSWFRRGFHPDDIDDRQLIDEHAPLVEADLRRA